jgi:hypothetical protein
MALTSHDLNPLAEIDAHGTGNVLLGAFTCHTRLTPPVVRNRDISDRRDGALTELAIKRPPRVRCNRNPGRTGRAGG